MEARNAILALAVGVTVGLAVAGDVFARGGRGGGHGSGAHASAGHAGTGHVSGGAHARAGSAAVARARGGGFGSATIFSMFFSAPVLAPGYYGYYGYPPNYTLPLASEYIEQDPAPRSPSDYWYYCPGSSTYYPYVAQCPEGWQVVEPLPPAPPA